MELIIETKAEGLVKDYIPSIIELKATHLVKISSTQALDELLKSLFQGNKVTVKGIIEDIKDYIQVVNNKDENSYTVKINESKVYLGTDVLYIDFINLIEYGNTEVSGLRIIHKVFDFIKDNANELLWDYNMRRIKGNVTQTI